MENPNILSGEELVAKGITKSDAALPEVGMKEVSPNGSWLEQKQIESALEGRKNLIEVERIEKNGTLSHAEWRDDLKLAEVTQQSGGYWQYLGHHVDKTLYLYPEEALYLMEVNCLQLKHNEVTVSLQKAYSLLLKGKVNNVDYKVYAYLSRLGYKVFRHNDDDTKINDDKTKIKDDNTKIKDDTKINDEIKASIESTSAQDNVGDNIEEQANPTDNPDINDNKSDEATNENKLEGDINENNETENTKSDEKEIITDTDDIKKIETDNEQTVSEVSGISAEDTQVTNESQINMEVDSANIINDTDMSKENAHVETSIRIKRTNEVTDDSEQNNKRMKIDDTFLASGSKLDMLKNRRIKPCDDRNGFKTLPDLFQKDTITINVPEEKYIPKNVFTNKLNYVLNVANITAKTGGRTAESQNYSMNDEVNNMNVRRLRGSSMNTFDHPVPPSPIMINRFPIHNPQFRPFHFMKSRCGGESFQYNFFYQRPFLPNCFVNSRLYPMMFRQGPHPNQNRPFRPRTTRVRAGDNVQRYHLECLKHLAFRLTNLVSNGNTQFQNIQSLQRLLFTYNRRYGTRLRLTEQLNIEDDNVVETIELDDDEEATTRQRISLDIISKNHVLNRIKKLSMKLQRLESLGKASAHKRAFSTLVKHFNTRYNADIYLNDNYEIIDRNEVAVDSSKEVTVDASKEVTVDSSSDSDCVIEETPKAPKLFRNPFSMMRERLTEEEADSLNTTDATTTLYDELKKVFNNWLPDAFDFGRAEVAHNSYMKTRLIEYYREIYLYQFLQQDEHKYNNWLEAKISFLTRIEDSGESPEGNLSVEHDAADSSGLSPIIKPEDCTDMPSMLKKLRIIGAYKDVDAVTSLKITFDVYNRDIQNFKKSDPPKPHFRVICIEESSIFPSGEDISALHNKYDDGVTIVFGIVGSSAISFLQINNIELPVNIPSNDFP